MNGRKKPQEKKQKNMKEVKYMKKFQKTMKKIEYFMNKGVFPGFSVAFIEEGKVTKFFEGTLTNHGSGVELKKGKCGSFSPIFK